MRNSRDVPPGGEVTDPEPEPQVETHAAGPAARSARLLDGLLERLLRGDVLERRVDGPTVDLLAAGRVVLRLRAGQGDVLADVDPRAGVGDAAALRRIGAPHPDRERSKAGWRRARVRTHADAARLVQALRP